MEIIKINSKKYFVNLNDDNLIEEEIYKINNIYCICLNKKLNPIKEDIIQHIGNKELFNNFENNKLLIKDKINFKINKDDIPIVKLIKTKVNESNINNSDIKNYFNNNLNLYTGFVTSLNNRNYISFKYIIQWNNILNTNSYILMNHNNISLDKCWTTRGYDTIIITPYSRSNNSVYTTEEKKVEPMLDNVISHPKNIIDIINSKYPYKINDEDHPFTILTKAILYEKGITRKHIINYIKNNEIDNSDSNINRNIMNIEKMLTKSHIKKNDISFNNFIMFMNIAGYNIDFTYDKPDDKNEFIKIDKSSITLNNKLEFFLLIQ